MTDSLLYLVHAIKSTCHQKKVVNLILLDIASAFPSAVTSRLLLNMQQLRYPTQLISFIQAMLDDRHTRITFNGFVSDDIDIDNGIGQGDPSSMILYLIYSYGLVAIPAATQGDGGAYFNNNFFTATGATFQECDEKLNHMLDKQ